MSISTEDWVAILLTLKLAATTTFFLLLFGIPLAWWLAGMQSRWKAPLSALIALPLVLPPTVLGFYLLIALSPTSGFGQLVETLDLGIKPFTFSGLVFASILYSMPFVVQPIQNAFEAIGRRPLDAAATLGAGPWQRFFFVALPLARPGVITAAVLGFAHTVGEFGVVLMIGGNIPGETQVVSVKMYEHVDTLEYARAHSLAWVMLGFSFFVLLALYWRFPAHRVDWFRKVHKSS